MALYYDDQVIANSVVYAAIGDWLIRKAKNSKLTPFINKQTYLLNHLAAVGISGIAALGINYTYTYTDDGVLQIVLTGLTWSGILMGMKQWLFQYILQQFAYNMKKEKVNE